MILDTDNAEIVVYGTTNIDELSSQAVQITVTYNDDSSSQYTLDFIIQMDVIDCTPDFSWLDTANATSMTILSSQSVTVAISSSNIPSDCPAIEDWILEFPYGNPDSSVLTEPVANG